MRESAGRTQAHDSDVRSLSRWRRLGAVTAAVLLCFLQPLGAEAAQPAESYIGAVCSEIDRLASVVQAEAFSQPWEARVAIAQIVAGEAEARGTTVCALTRDTWFVSVYRHALAHPYSWTMRQFLDVQPWARELAGAVLEGELADETRGARHFDGAPCRGVLWQAGQTWFCE